MSGTPTEPVTGRTGGGMSARVAAVVAVAVLLAAVWAGLSDRPADVAPQATPPLVVVGRPSPSPAPSPSPNPTPVVDESHPLPTFHAAPAESEEPRVIPLPYGPLGEDAFAVTVWLEERFYMSILREEDPGHLTAVMRLPLYAEMPTTTLQLIQLWTREDRPPLAEVADYEVDLGLLHSDPAPELMLHAVTDPRPRRAAAPRLVREGYDMRVTTELRDDHALLLFHVRVGNAPEPETADERLRRITRGWHDYGRRGQAFVLERTGPDRESREITLWSCTDQGLTWAGRQDCGAVPVP